MSARFSIIAGSMLAALVSHEAAAQGICVECMAPNRSYRCTVKDGERAQTVRGGTRALEFLCISDIARAGGHQSCRVGTSYSGPCIGQAYEIDLAKTAPESGVAAKPTDEDGTEAAPGTAAGGTPKKGPPQTLEELARDTMTKSKEQFSAADEKLRKAGDAVGGAMKRTWDCVFSLFSRC